MPEVWKTIFEQLPVDEEIVWIRVLGIYGELAKATFDATAQELTTVATGVTIPIYLVGRWKSQ